MAEAALKYDNYAYASYGASAVPADEPYAAPPAAAPRTRTRAAVRTRERQAARGGVSAFAIMGFVFVAALIALNIFWRSEIAQINADLTGMPATTRRAAVVGARQQLDTLNAEAKRLKIEYEQAFDITAIEAYAIERLGMTKPTDEAGETLSVTPRDKAVILGEEGGGADGAAGFFQSIREYFR
jgi:cell division protein FtsL